MSAISIGQALGAGFRLIGREPQAFAVWCGCYFVMALIPSLLGWEQTRAIYASFGDASGDARASMAAAQAQLGGGRPWVVVLGLAPMIVLPAAMFRAALYPDDRRFFYLRLSRRELWLWLNAVTLVLVMLVAWFAAVLTIGAVVGGGAAAGGSGGLLVVGILALVAVPAFFFAWPWLMARISMIPLMGFVERRFQLIQGWRFTKGHAWRIFLVALLLFLALIAIELVVLGSIFSAVGGNLETFGPAVVTWMSRITLPGMVLMSALTSVVSVTMYVVGTAAWADMYRQLNPDLEDTFA